MEFLQQKILHGDERAWYLGRIIGEGRYGVVFEAVDDSQRNSAVKCLKSEFAENDSVVRRVLREFTALHRLHHSAFPLVVDQGLTQDRTPFIVMELLRGETLEVYRRRAGGRLDVSKILRLADEALAAIDYAHLAGIIHRDICPNNLFVSADGKFKLLDLGLCKAIGESGAFAYITGPFYLGTPGFMAPEQARADWSELDERADLWSLGATLFVLLSGEPVHPGDVNEQLTAAASCPARSLRAVAPDVTEDVVAWIDRALAFKACDRWPSAAAMRAAIRLLTNCHNARDRLAARSISSSTAEKRISSTVAGSPPISSERPEEIVLHLVLSPDVRAPKTFNFCTGQERVLGRDAHLVHWCVDDPGISRTHAVFRRDQDTLTLCVVDLSSANGIYVNGKKNNTTRLKAGDVLRAGDSLFVVSEGNAAAGRDRDISIAMRRNAAFLVSGESGTGKEDFARDIHRKSGCVGRFVSISCAFTSYQEAAELLFGQSDLDYATFRPASCGLSRLARQGTVLLKDIGDTPLNSQPLLLRLFDEHRYFRSSDAVEAGEGFRIIATTHRPLKQLVEQGKFRLDLYARLIAHEIKLLPLRHRRQEILGLLADVTAAIPAQLRPDADAAEAILLASWPTNLHGLRRVMDYCTKRRQPTKVLLLSTLKDCEPELEELWRTKRSQERGRSVPVPKRANGALRDATTLQKYVALHKGNITHVARELGTTRAQVYRWMKRLGIDAVRSTLKNKK